MTARLCEIKLLSREECESILNRAFGTEQFELISYRVEYASDDSIGFLGEYFRLVVVAKFENGIQTHKFFIKTLPIQEIRKNFLIDSGIFYREVILYQELLKDLGTFSKRKWKPEHYLTRTDILVLEDFLVKDYYHIPNDSGFSKDQVKAVLNTLASLHASSIAYETSSHINIGEKFGEVLFETSVDEKIEWFLTGVRALRDAAASHPKFQSLEYQDFLANHFMEKIKPVYETVRPSKEFRNVLCHRDCWGRNVLFTKKGDSISSVLLDFQTCQYCPPAIDVLFCIYVNTRRKARQEILQECLDWYFKSLNDELKQMKINIEDHITWKEFLRSCDALKLMPLICYGLMFTLVYLPNNILIKIKRTDPEKFDYYANVNRSALVMDQLQKDATYREELFDAVEELVDFLRES